MQLVHTIRNSEDTNSTNIKEGCMQPEHSEDSRREREEQVVCKCVHEEGLEHDMHEELPLHKRTRDLSPPPPQKSAQTRTSKKQKILEPTLVAASMKTLLQIARYCGLSQKREVAPSPIARPSNAGSR